MIALPDEVWLLVIEQALPKSHPDISPSCPTAARLAAVSRRFLALCRRFLYARLNLPVLFEHRSLDYLETDPPVRRSAIVPTGQLEAVVEHEHLRLCVETVHFITFARKVWLDSDDQSALNQNTNVKEIVDGLPNLHTFVFADHSPVVWKLETMPVVPALIRGADSEMDSIILTELACLVVNETLHGSAALDRIKTVDIVPGGSSVYAAEYPPVLPCLLETCTQLSKLIFTLTITPRAMRAERRETFMSLIGQAIWQEVDEELELAEPQDDDGFVNLDGPAQAGQAENEADDGPGDLPDAAVEREAVTPITGPDLLFVGECELHFQGTQIDVLRRLDLPTLVDKMEASLKMPQLEASRNVDPQVVCLFQAMANISARLPVTDRLRLIEPYRSLLRLLPLLERLDRLFVMFEQLEGEASQLDTKVLRDIISALPPSVSRLYFDFTSIMPSKDNMECMLDHVGANKRVHRVGIVIERSQRLTDQETAMFEVYRARFRKAGKVLRFMELSM